MYVYVYYVYIYIYMYIYIYITHVYIYIYIYTCSYMYVYMCVCDIVYNYVYHIWYMFHIITVPLSLSHLLCAYLHMWPIREIIWSSEFQGTSLPPLLSTLQPPLGGARSAITSLCHSWLCEELCGGFHVFASRMTHNYALNFAITRFVS